MAWSVEEIRRLIRENNKSDVIARAKSHQDRIKFHVQTSLSFAQTQPCNNFTAFAKSLLPGDKYKTFLTLLQWPLKTNEVTEMIFDKLSRIFDGRNAVSNYQFANSGDRDDWEWYRQNVLGEPSVWQTKAWDFFKTEINSVLVVDLPAEQKDNKPSPYFYFLPIEDVITFETDANSTNMTLLVAKQGNDKVAVFDAQFYRLFDYKDGEMGALLDEKPHDLGYCPARFFWNEPISVTDPAVKKSPITKVLSSLDWLLFFHTSKKHLDLYGSYPIYSGFAQECDYDNEVTGEHCDGGFLKDQKGQWLTNASGDLVACPLCSNKRLSGPGSFIEVPVPGEDQPDLRNPVTITSVDRGSLEYGVAEEDRLSNNIISAAVGTEAEIVKTQAVNEKQVDASFETTTDILNRIKKGFEEAQKFVDETICRLRYGSTSFLQAQINYGTDFYTLTVAELREKYRMAKEAGSSEAELDALLQQIIETEYRHNPIQLQRMIILSDLEPYRHMSRNEAVNFFDKGLIPEEDLKVKLSFASLIKRFERENTNIIEFGSEAPYKSKIDTINQTIRQYVNERKQGPSRREGDS